MKSKSLIRMRDRRQTGFSLIELMVALVIGSLLIAGTVFVYVQSRNSYGVNETVARLQETARYAMSVIEPEVRMSSYWGLINDPELVNNRARQTDPVAAIAPGAAANVCGNNFAVDLYSTVEGTDNLYNLPCAAGPSGGASPTSDTLTIRRATAVASVATAGRLQLYTTRTVGQIFNAAAAPGPLAPLGRVNDLIVNAYYVSRDSDERAGLPSLRRKTLGIGPAFTDQEIIPGVEDMQVQFGIDPTGLNGTATRYVNPDDVIPATSQVVSVRVWFLVRADQPEVGFTDNRVYTYGNRVNYAPNDGFRRVLFTRTIQVRNSLG
ncbi:MAG TPA: PilW family protein [Longimicrobiales bacterium]|nr:PilW family protein [Longimicrobiales bacterium]